MVAIGPLEIDFEDDVVDKGYYIDGISFDRTEGGYPGSNVYLRDDDVRADIELDGRPREEITSYASVYHSSGAAAANREVSDGRTISHRLGHPGLAGRYIFVGTIGEESGLLYDTYEEELWWRVITTPLRNGASSWRPSYASGRTSTAFS